MLDVNIITHFVDLNFNGYAKARVIAVVSKAMTLSTDKCKYYLYNSIDQWVEICKEEYDHFMNCVPPRRFNGSWFLAGEAHTQLNNDKNIYLCCKEENGRYYCKYMTIEKYDSRDRLPIEYDQLYRWSGVMNLQMPSGEEPLPFFS